MSFRKSPYIATCIVIACCLFSMHGFAMLQNHKVKRNKQAHAERVTDANSLSSKILDTTAKAVNSEILQYSLEKILSGVKT